MRDKICDTIFILYLYADMCKMIHYTCDTDHEHKLCDDVRDTIIDFADELAEQSFGYYGKPSFSDFTLDHKVNTTNDIGKLCGYAVDVVEYIYKECKKDDKMSDLISLIDDYKGKMKKMAFLATFNKCSKFKFENN